MTELVLPAATLVAAIGLTYFFCVRPMRAGRCVMTAQPNSGAATTEDERREQAEIEAARAQVAALRASIATPVTAGSAPGSTPPSTDRDGAPRHGEGTTDAGTDRSA